MPFARLTHEKLPLYARCISQLTTRSHSLALTTTRARCLKKIMMAESDTPFARLAHERLLYVLVATNDTLALTRTNNDTRTLPQKVHDR